MHNNTTNAFPYVIAFDSIHSDAGRQKIKELGDSMIALNCALSFTHYKETILVDLTGLDDEAAELTNLFEASAQTDNLILLFRVTSAATIRALSALLTDNLAAERIGIAVTFSPDEERQSQVIAAVKESPVLYKGLWIEAATPLEAITLTQCAANWVISAPSSTDHGALARAQQLRSVCLSASMPLLELGAVQGGESADQQLPNHPFPEEWNVDFSRPGVALDLTVDMPVVELTEVTAEVVPDSCAIILTQEHGYGEDAKADFHELDRQIRQSIRFGLIAGILLKAIRDDHLWREGGYESWDAYCETFVELSRSHVNRLIAHATITEELQNCDPPLDPNGVPILPVGESQSRPLKRLKEANKRIDAWRLAVKRADGMPTASIVAKVVAELTPARPSSTAVPVNLRVKRKDIIGKLRQAIETSAPPDQLLALISQLEAI